MRKGSILRNLPLKYRKQLKSIEELNFHQKPNSHIANFIFRHLPSAILLVCLTNKTTPNQKNPNISHMSEFNNLTSIFTHQSSFKILHFKHFQNSEHQIKYRRQKFHFRKIVSLNIQYFSFKKHFFFLGLASAF